MGNTTGIEDLFENNSVIMTIRNGKPVVLKMPDGIGVHFVDFDGEEMYSEYGKNDPSKADESYIRELYTDTH